MSGHSKWNNIKGRKEKSDAQRGKIFTKIGREIAVAVKLGGADMSTNNRLYDVVQKARQNNMPNDNIMRSIKKASGELSGVNYEEVIYEGYGACGSAVIVSCLTDNKNRTAGDVRHLFDKYGAGLGQTNSVAYLFERKGVIVIEKSDEIDEESLMEKALECGASDFESFDDSYEVYTQPSDFHSVKTELEKLGFNFVSSSIDMIPNLEIELDEENLEKFNKLIDNLEDLDDVQSTYSNVK